MGFEGFRDVDFRDVGLRWFRVSTGGWFDKTGKVDILQQQAVYLWVL